MPQLVAQLPVVLGRPRVAPERLGAIRVVHRGGHANHVGPAPFAQHRKPGGRRTRWCLAMQLVPQLWALDALVSRRPHFNLLAVAPIETVGHYSMVCWQAAGQHVGLYRPGDARETGHQHSSVGHGGTQVWHLGQVPFPQTGHGQENQFGVHYSLYPEVDPLLVPQTQRDSNKPAPASATSRRSADPATSSAAAVPR